MTRAKTMSGHFERSSVLIRDGPGHCYNTIQSNCTTDHIRTYLKKGVVPKNGMLCEVNEDDLPFFAK